MSDILDKLADLHLQATTEKSHYYVAKCCKDAMSEIYGTRLLLQAETERRRACETLLNQALTLLTIYESENIATFKDYKAYKQKYQDKP